QWPGRTSGRSPAYLRAVLARKERKLDRRGPRSVDRRRNRSYSRRKDRCRGRASRRRAVQIDVSNGIVAKGRIRIVNEEHGRVVACPGACYQREKLDFVGCAARIEI